MAQITQRYSSHFGLDLKSSDLNRDPKYASLIQNAQYRKSGAPEKRRGWMKHSADVGAYGLFNYKYVDSNDQPAEQVISVGRSLYKLEFTSIAVSYSGVEAAAYLSFYFDPTTDAYRCLIIAGLSQVLDFSCGQGFDEVSPITVTQLATAINAVTGFTAVVTGDGSVPAAYLKIIREIDVKTTTWTGKAGYWSAVNSPITNPFDGSYTRRNSLEFENVSAVNLTNVIFLSNGYDELYKYDGQNLYRAGMPVAASLTSAINGAPGLITGTKYVHRIQYIQKDNVGNEVAGNILPVTGAGLDLTLQKADLVIANILAASGFNTNCAIVAGAQATVNQITVDDGSGGQNTMKVGDTAYFYDGVSAAYVERLVTARNGTSITVAGAPVTVADNAVISNNLRIQVQRNKTSSVTPTVFYEVVQLPNNSFTATQAYTDNIVDSSLGALIEPPATDRSLPPKGKYIAAFQNLLFSAGNPEDPTRLRWSDVDSPEYFPADTNQEKIQSTLGDPISGIGKNGSVMGAWTKRSTHVGTGTFGDNNCRFEERTGGIGCSSHASIVSAETVTTWWSDRGPYKMVGGQIPEAVGATAEGESRISPVMDQPGFEFSPTMQPQFYRSKRVVGINWIQENKVLFFLPCESLSGSDRYANSSSRVFAYDYTRDAWLQWTNWDMIGGAVLYQDEFYFKGRRLDPSNAVRSELHRVHNLNDAWDYQDNVDPIEWEYGPQWEHGGRPGVLKKFLEIQLYSLEEVQNNDFEITIKQEVNFQKDAIVAEFDIALTGSGYGQSSYGLEPYGDPSNPKFKHELARTRTYATRTRFYNNEAQQNCVLSGWEYLVEAPYRLEFKK